MWRIANRLEALQVRHLGFSGISVIRRTNVLVLETTGRRTGRRRRTAVAYWTRGDVHLVGGGAAGMSKVDWVANLRASPDAVIYVRRRRIPVTAREARGGDYSLARSEAIARWPDIPLYEHRSNRRVPYFELVAKPARRD